MKLQLVLCSLLMLQSYYFYGQSDPVTDSLTINNISAYFQSDGTLFHQDGEGRFGPSGESSLVRGGGIWIGGISPNGELRLSAQLNGQDDLHDFVPGVLDWETGDVDPIPFNNVWKVNRGQIIQHIEDYDADQIIDTKIPAIYAWPGRGNPYFSEYNNGMELPTSPFALAPFFDRNGNLEYEPDQGDHPYFSIRGCEPLFTIPNQMLWFPFHDNTQHIQSQGNPLKIQFYCTAFSLNCSDNEALNDAIFVHYNMHHLHSAPLDSVYMGMYMDPTIGCPEDDFYGVNPLFWNAFAYNGNDTDESCPGFEGAGENPPAFGFDVLRSIQQIQYNEDSIAIGSTSSPSVAGSNINPSDLQTTADYYELLTGSYTNGSPIENDGFPYPDLPTDDMGISEYTSENTPGDRKILFSHGPTNLHFGDIREALYVFSLKKDANSGLENFEGLWNNLLEIQTSFHNCLVDCNFLASSVSEKDLKDQITLFPNPASDWLKIESENLLIQTIRLTDISGKELLRKKVNAREIEMPLPGLASGLYLLDIQTEKGQIVKKLVIH
ncbi:MAG: T9SS type A sorting domain-containing protein [Bacteroidetes bacterium]|nr:T9SS type A sorting domain-containing protein [Bacteroidota bacterium]